MKKVLCMILVFCCALLAGCMSDTLPAESFPPAESKESTGGMVESIEESSVAEESVQESVPPQESAPEEDVLTLEEARIQRNIGNKVFLLAGNDENGGYAANYYYRDKDGKLCLFHTEDDFVDGYMDWIHGGKYIVLNNYTWEQGSDVYLFDIESGEKRLLTMDLPKNELVTAMKWLDHRYFLFVSQFDHGTVEIGGDIWVYDTETDEAFLVIDREDGRLQIRDMMVLDGLILLDVPYYDEEYIETEQHYYAVSAKTVYSCIEEKQPTVIRPGEWIEG